MEDINPGYVPRALKPIPMNRQGASASTANVARPDKGKGRAKEQPPRPRPEKPGLLKFFAPQVREAPSGRDGGAGARSVSGPGPGPAIGPGPQSGSSGSASPARPAMAVGKRSGKRTLAGVMDDEIAAKQKKQEDAAAAAGANTGAGPATPRVPTTSKFFHAAQRSVSDPRGDRLGWARPVATPSVSTPNHARRGHGHERCHSQQQPVAGSSGLSQREKEKEKENVQPEADEVVDADMDADADVDMGAPDAIAQEDGYASPTESMGGQWDSPEISSPVRPGAGRRGGDWEDEEEDEYDADVLSSSPVAAHPRTRKRPAVVVVERVVTRVLPLRPVLNTSFSQRKRARTRSRSRSRSRTRRKPFGGSGEEEEGGSCGGDSAAGRDGPDLRRVFDEEFDDIHDWDEVTSGGEDCEGGLDGDRQGCIEEDVMFSTASSTPGPVTPATDGDDMECEGQTSAVPLDEGSSEELDDHSHNGAASLAAQNAKVAHGWWERWARSGASAHGQGANTNSSPNMAASAGSDQHRPPLSAAAVARTRTPGSGLRRRETTMTPDGRQRPPRGMAREGPYSAPQVSKRKGLQQQEDLRVTRRRSLAFTSAEAVRTTPKPAGAKVLAPTSRARAGAGAGNSDNPGVSTSTVTGGGGLTVSTRNRLEQFRCVRSQ
ncbi:hypothetical protein LXA43DRAFT_1048706 [Ganoderma leucocontextum]|nr:hypothetical protein LXA43DRAFT_1048706 [Ganoderma leucocontextum]